MQWERGGDKTERSKGCYMAACEKGGNKAWVGQNTAEFGGFPDGWLRILEMHMFHWRQDLMQTRDPSSGLSHQI